MESRILGETLVGMGDEPEILRTDLKSDGVADKTLFGRMKALISLTLNRFAKCMVAKYQHQMEIHGLI